MAVSTLGAVNRKTLREQVLAQLRQAIVSGQLEPGARLAEVDLAAQLGVSRGTVREALRTLEQSGLVTEAERTGLCVRRPTTREVGELFDVRASLEALAAALVMGAADSTERLAQLRSALPPEAGDDVSFADRVTRDLAFHERLCELADNGVLLETWRLLHDRMLVVILSDPGQAARPIMTRDNHEPILGAMAGGDVLAAQAAVREHMTRAATLYEAHADDEPDAGPSA